MVRHAKRTDANHSAIRDGLRQIGYNVTDTSHIGNGYPDLTVKIGCKLPILLEVKDPAKPKSAQALTEKEVAFFDLFMPRATHQQRDASGISLSKNGWRRRRKRKNEKQEKNGRVAPACTEHIMF